MVSGAFVYHDYAFVDSLHNLVQQNRHGLASYPGRLVFVAYLERTSVSILRFGLLIVSVLCPLCRTAELSYLICRTSSTKTSGSNLQVDARPRVRRV